MLIESGVTSTEIQMLDDLLQSLGINEEHPYSIQEALDLWVLRINETVLPNLEKGIQDIDKLLEPLIKVGDLTGSGNVDIQDVTLAMQYVLGLKVLTSEQKIAADVNGDGKVDIRDVVHIMQKVLLLIDRFPVEQ